MTELKHIFLLFLTLVGISLTAQYPLKLEIVKDINPNGDSNPVGFVKLGISIFFSANDGVNGRELWVTDGSTAGTQLLKDVKPGPGPGVHSKLVTTKDKFFFVGDDGIHGKELWVSDGTSSGTFMVKDINTGSQPYSNVYDESWLSLKKSIDDKFFFFANDGIHGVELWVTNGTETGTYMVKDIEPGALDPQKVKLTDAIVFNNQLFFVINDSVHGFELWATDGTEIGTELVKDINTGIGNGFPDQFYSYDGRLYFSACDSFGCELWVSDGTELGTNLVKNINSVDGSFPRSFYGFNGRVYFAADVGNSKIELYVTDGTSNNTHLFKILDSSMGSSPSNFIEYEGELFFSAYTSAYWRELWVTDGTTNGTRMVVDLNSNLLPPPFYNQTKSSYLSPVFQFNNYLILNGLDGNTTGIQLWVMDESKDSVTPLSPLPGYSPTMSYFNGANLNGSQYFTAEYDTISGIELWRLYASTAVGIEENKPILQSNIKVYPNPNTGNLITLELNAVFKGTIQIEMLDLLGKRIRQWVKISTPNQSIQIPTKGLKQGVYFIKVSSKNYEETVRFVKM